MKYIRIKDGIFEVEKLNLDKIVGAIQYHILDNILIKRMYGSETHMYKYKILAQADTIEELCDDFILKEKMREVIYYHKSTKFDDLKTIAMLNERYTLYGAIWTIKGLIYVAKMNSEGKLVLI